MPSTLTRTPSFTGPKSRPSILAPVDRVKLLSGIGIVFYLPQLNEFPRQVHWNSNAIANSMQTAGKIQCRCQTRSFVIACDTVCLSFIVLASLIFETSLIGDTEIIFSSSHHSDAEPHHVN